MSHSHSNSVLLEPNQSAELIWKFNTNADLEAACNVPGHYEAGMIAKINSDTNTVVTTPYMSRRIIYCCIDAPPYMDMLSPKRSLPGSSSHINSHLAQGGAPFRREAPPFQSCPYTAIDGLLIPHS